MNRRKFLQAVPLAGIASTLSTEKGFASDLAATAAAKPASDRDYNVQLLLRISNPVINALSEGKLKAQMPTEKGPDYAKPVDKVTYLEAFGRTMSGLAPWLNLPADNTPEGIQRARLLAATHAAMDHATNPGSPDFMNFTGKFDSQPLVDGAFLALGLLRGKDQIWGKLPASVQQQTITALKELRSIRAYTNNWVLFSAIIEAFLLQVDAGWDRQPVDFAVQKMMDWYKGDSMYGDGTKFHFDYYNAFVMHPMLTETLRVMAEKNVGSKEQYELAHARMQRYGVILERQISPEGTFPVVGRSMPYRSGAFQPLAMLALQEQLPKEINPAQVRSALTAVNKRIYEAPGTFDKDGWLQIGFCGHQPEIAEGYISTGSLYLCTNSFLPLGLPAAHSFWTAPAADWTAKMAYSGGKIRRDHAIDN
ncbi:DUF2264 domain-containing protein [Chitinophaga sp. Cy-1792]|uniref:DUF2264 domain-containing protein n=1 Tax=Chitinophaga sp. Cy-1792 TaxID=2608339 RepID=UPI001420D5BB|nr:DUF2264 domain-containing protein [Chitinophaga sp. Cy-1792]